MKPNYYHPKRNWSLVKTGGFHFKHSGWILRFFFSTAFLYFSCTASGIEMTCCPL